MDPTLLLIRPKEQSQAFLAACEARLGREIPHVISPIIDIRPVDALPNPSGFDAIIFTSANGVRAANGALSGARVFTVGDATADLARGFGATATALGENLDEFLSRAEALPKTLAYGRGRHVSGDLASALSAAGKSVTEVVLYDQIEQPLTAQASELLSSKSMVCLPLFSARSANLISAKKIIAPILPVAISAKVAHAWTGPGTPQVAEHPTQTSICDKVIAAF